MYVEDEHLIRKSIGRIIRLLGHEVKLAEDGIIGYDLFKKYRENLDLVLTDLKMPNLDGIGFARKIKENYPNSKIPVIALTGHNSETQEYYWEASIKEVYNKPINLKDIETLIREHAVN